MKSLDYEERKQRGSPDFPIEYYYLDKNDYRYVMQLHWQRDFELVHVVSGSLRLYLNNKEHILNEGDFAFISALVLHRAEPENCVYECLVFDMNIICSHSCSRVTEYLIPFIIGDCELTYIEKEKGSALSAASRKLFSLFRKKPQFYELAVASALNEMFFYLMEKQELNPPNIRDRGGHKRKAIASVVDWIERNYHEKITLRRLSEFSDLNEKYLCRIFREFTGQSPTEYINRLRVERACFEMSVNGKNVTEAALDCGFNDLSYFSRTFKKYKGILPREFMNERR